MANKTWFITGTSRGFGREWTKAALERGDRVAATARDTSTLDDLKAEHGDALLPLTLDVTDREAAFGAVKQAHEHFGRLDIVVNNAGYGHFGMVEEISEQEARAQIETNLFGALWVTQAALPFLREQGSGHIVQVSSIGGHLGVPERRDLSRLEVGVSRGSVRRSPRRSRSSGSTSRWSSPAGSRPIGAVRRPSARTPTPPTTDSASASSSGAPATCRVTRPPRPRRSCASSTPTRRRCGCSSAPHRWVSPRRITRAASRPGASGSRWPSWLRE